MARGAPDYATVFGEVLGARAYTDYVLWTSGVCPAGSSVFLTLGTVSAGYEIYQAIGIVSASGCDTIHEFALYVNNIIQRDSFFEIEQSIFYPRQYIARAGDVMTAIFENWDAVSRIFTWCGVGTYLTIGSPPLKPSLAFGKKPKLKADEVLWQADCTMFGKRWVKAKQQKITTGGMEIPTLLIPETKEIIENGS